MNKIKNLIIIMIILIIILIVLLYSIDKSNILNNTDNISNYTYNDIYAKGEEQERNTVLEEYPDISEIDYISIEKCISNFLDVINKNSSSYYGAKGQKTTSDEEIYSIILKLLSQNYINKNNITLNNVNNYVYDIDKKTFFIPTKIRKFYDKSQVNSFVVKGLVEDISYNHIADVILILNVDTSNATFSIEIVDNEKEISLVTPTKLEKIDKNNMNKFQYAKINEEKNIITEITNLYKRTILGYPEIFYENNLDNKYREKRFSNLNDFKSYVERNKELISKTHITKYKKLTIDNNNIYILEDQYGNRIIIYYNSIQDYKVYLDTYTIEIDYFKEIYNNGNETTKINYNINKIKEMLNFKDYSAIYNKLNTTFRNNNYPTVNQLEEVIKNNVYQINSITINSFQEEQDYYVCECTLTNMEDESENKNINIILKLIDSNNFEMSFSFE